MPSLRGCVWCHLVSLSGPASRFSQLQVLTRLENGARSMSPFSLKFRDFIHHVMNRFSEDPSGNLCHGFTCPATSWVDTLDLAFSWIFCLFYTILYDFPSNFEDVCEFLLGFYLIFFVLSLTNVSKL